MHASSMSEAGAFRIVIAVVLATLAVGVVGVTVSTPVAVAAAILLTVAGFVYETLHMRF